MEIQSYLDEMKSAYHYIIDYIENENQYCNDMNDLVIFLNSHIIKDKKHELKDILHLITKIANEHHRTPDFFMRLEQIIQIFAESIKNNFTNNEIFNVFQSNKRLLLFLIKEKLLTIDKSIALIIASKKFKKKGYANYFFPEIKSFINIKLRQEIECENNQIFKFQELENKYDEIFEKRRKIGENDSYLCEMIRNDSIEDFIISYSRTNFSLSRTIDDSIFETNCFLLKNNPTLIEYSAFYGSIQIFRYLYMNGVNLSPKLMLYVIHGHNPELVHIVEENHIISSDFYQKCLKESIKCHHNTFVSYLKDNFCDNQLDNDYKLLSKSMKYYNYLFFPNELKNNIVFHDLCRYGNEFIVEKLLNCNDVDVNSKIILFNVF